MQHAPFGLSTGLFNPKLQAPTSMSRPLASELRAASVATGTALLLGRVASWTLFFSGDSSSLTCVQKADAMYNCERLLT